MCEEGKKCDPLSKGGKMVKRDRLKGELDVGVSRKQSLNNCYKYVKAEVPNPWATNRY